MSKKEKDVVSFKKASTEARYFIKRMKRHKFNANVVLSVVVLAVGIALGIAFDEFELFLSIAVALDIVIIIVTQRKNNM